MQTTLLSLAVLLIVQGSSNANFDFIILHNNDMHGRFEETTRSSGTCRNLTPRTGATRDSTGCVGGFARTAHVIRKYRKLADEGRGSPVLFLNAGDTYVGTPWFAVHKWNITVDFMNILRPDAMNVLGITSQLGSVHHDVRSYERNWNTCCSGSANEPEVPGLVDNNSVPVSPAKGQQGLLLSPKKLLVNRTDSPSSWSNISETSKVSDRILRMSSPTKHILKSKCQSLSVKIKKLRNKLKARQSKSYRLKKKVTSFSVKTVLENLLRYRSLAVTTFIMMQLFHQRRTKWSQAEKDLALSLHYKSPGAYKFMLQNLKFTLPSIRTIQSWLKVNNLRTGVKTALSSKLALKAKTMTEREKQCVVMFDELSLKKMLEYNQSQDIVEGYQDLGTLGREDNLANTALVFLIRGLHYNWRIPFGYFVSAGPVKGNSLQQIIVNVITELRKLSFDPRVIVCDQGANNRRAFSLLGATKQKPSIEIGGKKVYTIFDVPHLLKSLRNNFMNTNHEIVVNGKLISWNDVTKTYEIDQKSMTTRAMLKITLCHILPTTFQKMRVKLAAQIFSRTVAAAISTATLTQQLKSSTAQNTAEFIQNVNDIFDALNSRTLDDPNPNRRPLSIYKKKSLETLEKGLKYFESIEVKENNKKRNNIYCIDGFQWTIKAILLLWNDLQGEGIKYLLTSFLNQDPLENFFSVVRNRGGYNPTPTVRQCRIAIQQNMNIRLQMTTNSGNCMISDSAALDIVGVEENNCLETEQIQSRPETESDEDHPKTELRAHQAIDMTEDSNKENVSSNLGPSSSSSSTATTLETCSNVYVAGYLLYKLEKKFNCAECSKFFTKSGVELTNSNEFFLMSKDYSCGGKISFLKRPSDQFASIMSHLLNEFNYAFERYKCHFNVAKKIKAYLRTTLEHSFLWYIPHGNSKCEPHKEYILDLFLKMKMFRHLKWETAKHATQHSSKTPKPHRKVRILSTAK